MYTAVLMNIQFKNHPRHVSVQDRRDAGDAVYSLFVFDKTLVIQNSGC